MPLNLFLGLALGGLGGGIDVGGGGASDDDNDYAVLLLLIL